MCAFLRQVLPFRSSAVYLVFRVSLFRQLLNRSLKVPHYYLRFTLLYQKSKPGRTLNKWFSPHPRNLGRYFKENEQTLLETSANKTEESHSHYLCGAMQNCLNCQHLQTQI